MVGLVRGSISKVITSYPSSRSRLATDPVPENKSKALPLLWTLRLAVCPTGLSAFTGKRSKTGGVTGSDIPGKTGQKREDEDVGVGVGNAEGGVAVGLVADEL